MSEVLDMLSRDVIKSNIELIAGLFPSCVIETDGKKAIDFDLLKQELSHELVEGTKERYRLEWPGKREAIVTANLPTTKTLRPVREDSVNFNNTENLYIEGDNLEVLKLLQESYLGKIKIIYIDPPYNTGNDFVYKDKFAQDLEEFKQESGLVDEYNRRLVPNPETAGRYHSDWLSMMYPRLRLAKNLLSDDGLIFISIDDNEVHNLRKICDEVFGEGNYRNQIAIRKGAKSVQSQFATWDKLGSGYETILLYSKDPGYRFPKQLKELDDVKKGAWNNHWRGSDRPTMRYELFGIKPETGQWRWAEDRSLNGIKNYNALVKELEAKNIELTDENFDEYYSQKFGDERIDLLRLSKNGKPEHFIPPSKYMLLNDVWFDAGTSSSSEVTSLFDQKIFDNPKPTNIIKQILRFGSATDIVLDFFSGSATTAHAVMQLNAETGSRRKFIMVQVPEATSEKSDASKAGYATICEIGKERIRRAAIKIKVETGADIDYGFRVYRLDESNMQDTYYLPQDYRQDMLDLFADNVKPDRTPDDLLAQVMLDWGLPLSLPIVQATVTGKRVFQVADNSLFACFDKGIDEAFAREVANEVPLRIVFRDSSFKHDTAKDNVKQLLKQLSPGTEMRVI